jgi:type I restriction enzyme S subunit
MSWPDGWRIVSVGSLATFSSGQGINISRLHDYSNDFPVPVYGGNGIAGYTSTHCVNAPTVVVGRVGQRCGEVHFAEGPTWITDNALYPVRVYQNLDMRCFALALSNAGLNQSKNRNDLPLLTQSIIHAILIPWPSDIAEQRAIATALSDVDALLGGLDRLIAKKRDLKQAAMQQLLTGQTRLPGFHGEWEVKRLGDVGQCLRGVSYRGDADLAALDTAHTKRLLRANNVQNAVVVTQDVQYVNADRVSRHQILRLEDILVCMANGSKVLVGKAGLFAVEDGHEYTFGAFMGCFRTDARAAHPHFVFALFQTGQYRDFINNLLAGSSINNLRPGSVESLPFRFPDPQEQTAIAAVLSDMDTELSALEARCDKTRDLKQAMMQELLTGKTRLI